MISDKHIASVFDRDLETVQALVVKMGGMVESAIADAGMALETRDEELAEVTRTARRDDTTGSGRFRALAARRLRPALVAGIGLQILGQASGVNTVIYYAPTIFGDAGLGASSAIVATVGVGTAEQVDLPVGTGVADRVGQRGVGAVQRVRAAVAHRGGLDVVPLPQGRLVVRIDLDHRVRHGPEPTPDARVGPTP